MIDLKLELPIQTAFIHVRDVQVTKDRQAFSALQDCGRLYLEKYRNANISEIPGVQVARQLFRMLGIEPTKHRPSSEAMLRRILKELPLSPINNLVDVSNWCALDFLLPNGVYDFHKIVGDITLRKGGPDESYWGISNREIHLEDRFTLVDAAGPFGSPMTDSQRSAVDPGTLEAIAIMYATPQYDRQLFLSQAETYATRIVRICGGTIAAVRIIDHPDR